MTVVWIVGYVVFLIVVFIGSWWLTNRAIHVYRDLRCRHGHQYRDSVTGYITRDFCWRGHGRLPVDQWATSEQTSALRDTWGGFVA